MMALWHLPDSSSMHRRRYIWHGSAWTPASWLEMCFPDHEHLYRLYNSRQSVTPWALPTHVLYVIITKVVVMVMAPMLLVCIRT